MQPISVILYDNNAKYRIILEKLLVRSGVSVLESFNLESFDEQAPTTQPDIALIAFTPGLGNTGLIPLLRVKIPSIKIVLMVSVYDNTSLVNIKTLDLDGLIYKASDDPNEMLTMLKTVKSGGKYFPVK